MLKQLLALLGYVPQRDLAKAQELVRFYQLAIDTQNQRLEGLIEFTHKLRDGRPEDEVVRLWN